METEKGFEPLRAIKQLVLQTSLFDHSSTPSKFPTCQRPSYGIYKVQTLYVVIISRKTYILKNKKTRILRIGFLFYLVLFYQSMISLKPEPVSAILFLPVKSEQNMTIPLRLEVDVIMAVDMCLYVFIFIYYKFVLI